MSEAEKGPHSDVLQQFLHSPWWESPELEATLLSPDCVVEYPFAPPGMPKQFPTTKRALLAEWLKRTTRKWSRDQIVHYPTKGGSREWVESHTSAEVQWGPHAVFRPFSCEQIELFEFSNGKISLIRSWCDPMAFYLGAGINLPVFNYSGVYPSVEDTPARAATNSPHPGKGEAEKRLELFNYFLKPDFTDPDRDTPAHDHLFSPDFVLRMPFMMAGMQRVFDAQFKASTHEWVGRTLLQWEQNSDYQVDEFVSEDVVIVESNGSHGLVRWDPSGATSGYWNDYVIFVSLKDFRLREFREYLDPINKLIAAGASVPVFPFYY